MPHTTASLAPITQALVAAREHPWWVEYVEAHIAGQFRERPLPAECRAAIGAGAWCGPRMTRVIVDDMAAILAEGLRGSGAVGIGGLGGMTLIRAGYTPDAVSRFGVAAVRAVIASSAADPIEVA